MFFFVDILNGLIRMLNRDINKELGTRKGEFILKKVKIYMKENLSQNESSI